MSNDITLRELMEEKFQRLDNQLVDIRDSLKYLSENMVLKDRFNSKMFLVKELRAMVDSQDERIDNVEHFQSVLKYVGGLIVLIVVAIITTWATGLI